MYYNTDLNMTLFTDREYIQIALANTYGKDKLNWDERLIFVESRTREELWELVDTADEPYQYRKALHALEDLDAGKPTGYTMGLDSTASGGQMFAILSGCHQSAEKVNLMGDGIRHDLYEDIGQYFDAEISRSDLKDAIMTGFYQSTAVPERVFGDQVQYFYNVLEQNLKGAYEVLQLCSAAQACIGASYSFKNPSGHDVLIRQKIVKDYRVEAKTGYDWTENYHFNQQRKEFGLKVDSRGNPSDKSIAAK